MNVDRLRELWDSAKLSDDEFVGLSQRAIESNLPLYTQFAMELFNVPKEQITLRMDFVSTLLLLKVRHENA